MDGVLDVGNLEDADAVIIQKENHVHVVYGPVEDVILDGEEDGIFVLAKTEEKGLRKKVFLIEEENNIRIVVYKAD